MSQKLKIISETSLILGYNDRDKPENLRHSDKVYMADIKNGFVDENKLIKRNGYSTIGNAATSKIILGQERHEPSGGSKFILRVRNDATDTNSEIEGWSGSGNFAKLTNGDSQTADLLHEFIMAEGATYIFNGTDEVVKTTNGTSVSGVAAVPKGSSAKWWHNFFFVYGVTGNTSRLYFSDVNTPETFDAVNGYIDINTDDNESITALGAVKDELVIFKETKAFLLTGYGVTDFALTDLSDFAAGGIGTPSQRSVVETGNDVYYLSFQGGTPHFRSIKRTSYGALVDGGIISDEITGTMNRLVVGRLNQCSGVFDGRRIWWSVCTTGTTNNEVLIYDTITKGWVRFTGIAASVLHLSTISGSISMYFGSSTANGKSYHLDTSISDNGTAIDFLIDTPMYAPYPGRKCRWKYLYMTADVESDVDISILNSPDGFTFDELGTMNLTGTGAAFGTATFGTSKWGATTIARDRLDYAGGSAYFMQYRFRNNTADEEVSIREWELFYSVKGLRAV